MPISDEPGVAFQPEDHSFFWSVTDAAIFFRRKFHDRTNGHTNGPGDKVSTLRHANFSDAFALTGMEEADSGNRTWCKGQHHRVHRTTVVAQGGTL
jgi:hypothetical protein